MSDRDVTAGRMQPSLESVDRGGIIIPESELSFEAVHASGPGGQNINKVASAIRLTFDPAASSLLDDASRARLIQIARSYLDRAGRINILARRFRSQEQNRRDAIERLQRLIVAALEKPTPRHPTRPTRSSQFRRLERKSLHKRIKKLRRRPSTLDE